MSCKHDERMRRYERLQGGESVAHGRLSTYNNWGCRCSACTGAYMEWYGLYSTRRPPRQRALPVHLRVIADESSDELAQLIQEQYNDDMARRVGFAVRLPRFDSEGVNE